PLPGDRDRQPRAVGNAQDRDEVSRLLRPVLLPVLLGRAVLGLLPLLPVLPPGALVPWLLRLRARLRIRCRRGLSPRADATALDDPLARSGPRRVNPAK